MRCFFIAIINIAQSDAIDKNSLYTHPSIPSQEGKLDCATQIDLLKIKNT